VGALVGAGWYTVWLVAKLVAGLTGWFMAGEVGIWGRSVTFGRSLASLEPLRIDRKPDPKAASLSPWDPVRDADRAAALLRVIRFAADSTVIISVVPSRLMAPTARADIHNQY